MSTPPSNVTKGNKYNIIDNSTQNGMALFSCTPKEEVNKPMKEEQIKPTTSFN